jgi:hypothetical protein
MRIQPRDPEQYHIIEQKGGTKRSLCTALDKTIELVGLNECLLKIRDRSFKRTALKQILFSFNRYHAMQCNALFRFDDVLNDILPL